MKIFKNKLFSALVIILIGGLSSFFIFKIAAETDELALIEYFDKIILIFVVVLAAMAIASFIGKKSKK